MNTIEDQERAAYISGDTDRADLLARILELEGQRDVLEGTLEAIADAMVHNTMTPAQVLGAALEGLRNATR